MCFLIRMVLRIQVGHLCLDNGLCISVIIPSTESAWITNVVRSTFTVSTDFIWIFEYVSLCTCTWSFRSIIYLWDIQRRGYTSILAGPNSISANSMPFCYAHLPEVNLLLSSESDFFQSWIQNWSLLFSVPPSICPLLSLPSQTSGLGLQADSGNNFNDNSTRQHIY